MINQTLKYKSKLLLDILLLEQCLACATSVGMVDSLKWQIKQKRSVIFAINNSLNIYSNDSVNPSNNE